MEQIGLETLQIYSRGHIPAELKSHTTSFHYFVFLSVAEFSIITTSWAVLHQPQGMMEIIVISRPESGHDEQRSVGQPRHYKIIAMFPQGRPKSHKNRVPNLYFLTVNSSWSLSEDGCLLSCRYSQWQMQLSPRNCAIESSQTAHRI